jgi:hypothetical protein
MPNLRKIFIASGTPQKFAFLQNRFGDNFKITDDSSEADLIIVDLANPVLPSWVPRSASAQFFAGPCCPPFVLTALDGPEDQNILTTIRSVFPDMQIGQVYKQRQEVEETLAWLQSILPFSNVRNLQPGPAFERLKNDMILRHLREGV